MGTAILGRGREEGHGGWFIMVNSPLPFPSRPIVLWWDVVMDGGRRKEQPLGLGWGGWRDVQM